MKSSKFSRKWKIGAVATMLTSLSLGAISACSQNGESSSSEPIEGIGVFYFDAGVEEYQLFLNDNGQAIYIANGESKMGTYTSTGSVVTLKFDGEQEESSATLDGDVLTWTYNNEQMRFYMKVHYTVSYEELGGEEVADSTVVNGKTVSKPADPVREGYEFLGWYLDSEYQTPYMFDTQIVTGDLTLYAQWALKTPGEVPYTVDFDLGYEAAEDAIPADMETIGGKLYNAPVPERTGYKFCGWWISAYENGKKLTYKYTEDTVFEANTTLFAVWEKEDLGSKLSAPQAEVVGNFIRWEGVQGVSVYRLKVTGPDGFLAIDEDVSATSYAIDFEAAPEGDYEIEVTAVASNQNNNSETVKRSYKNKAVGRVSQFSVLDGKVLLFNRVENAEVYYVTVECGNSAHGHVMYNNGDATYYSFANCDMKEGGIRFTVTAAADGYAAVESETFVYNRMLDKVEGLTVDEETQMVSWYAVKDATSYIVSVSCGNSMHEHEYVNVGSKTSYSLKECPAVADGEIKINVYPQTKGYNSPAPTEYSYKKTKLASPSNVTLSNVESSYILTWDAVKDATEYSIRIGNSVFSSNTNSIDLTEKFIWVPETKYEVEVKAMSATNESAWSDKVDVRYYAMANKVTYKKGVVSWEPVIGATAYELKVNDGAIQTIRDGATSAEVVLTQEGVNTVYVRFIDETSNYYSPNWVTCEVTNAQEVIFDSRGGSPVSSQYKVTGDPIKLPVPTREGYEFVGWYNTPKGPESNGALYESDTFTENTELILYAYWTSAKYTLTYAVGEGGTLDKESGEAYYLKDYKLDVPVVEDGTKVFLGWFAGTGSTSEQLTDDRGYSLKPWSVKQSTTVYAQYISNVLTYTLLEDGTYSVSRGINATKMTSITIPQKYNSQDVTVVDGYAFQNCSRLVTVNIPDTIKIVSEETAFEGCRKLQEVNVYETEPGGNKMAVYSSVDGALLYKNEITGAMELSFYPKGKTGAYVIPDGVTEIPLRLFDSTQVTEVTIPTTVSVIRSGAFINCSTLKKVIFAAGGTDELVIENEAFKSCTALESITLPARLSELQINEETHTMSIFSGCTSLTHLNVERGNQVYASNDGVITNKAGDTLIFCPTARKGSYTVPQGVETIGAYAFADCKMLTEIVIPGYVETVSEYAFAGCSKVASIVFSGGAVEGMKTTVGDYAFSDMTTLRAITFETGSVVSSLGAYAFSGASSLRSLTIPTTMEYIGDYAFEKAQVLNTVSFADGKEGELEFGNYVFSECLSLLRVELPKSVTKLNLGVFDGCVNIAEIKVDADNEYYKDIDGVVLSKDGKELLFFPKGRQTESGEYDIPTGVERISDGAFAGMRYITKIVIDNTVTYIGKHAFKDSLALADLTFEEGNDTALLTIADEAFASCSAIKSVILPARTQTIGAYAFYAVNMQSVEFPADLQSIGDYAFARTALTSVEIPADVEYFGENVFNSCILLSKVSYATNYTGTSIPVGTFKGTAITTITIPASIETVGQGAFSGCTKLTEVIFEEGDAPLTIGVASTAENTETASEEGVFMACSALASVNIPDRAILIGKLAFANCSVLETVSIKETSKLQRIGDSAFTGCMQLSSFYIPKTVQNSEYVNESISQEYAIGNNAFATSGLTSVTFAEGGEGDLSIGYGAFVNCGSVTWVEGKFGLEPVYEYMTTITLPARVAPIYYIDPMGGNGQMREGVSLDTFRGNGDTVLTEINIEKGGKYYASQDGILYKVKEVNGEYVPSQMMMIPGNYAKDIVVPYTVELIGEEEGAISVVQSGGTPTFSSLTFEETPEGVEPVGLTVGYSAFSGKTNLKTVKFPNRLVKLCGFAFSECSGITSLTLPASLESMGGYAFNKLTGMTSLTFEKGIKLKEIPNNAFYGCNNKSFTALEIPASVETIGESAFFNCSYVISLSFEDGSQLKTVKGSAFQGMKFTSIVLPDMFTTIDGNIFGTSNSYLTSITLPKTFMAFTTVVNSQPRFFLNGMSSLKEVNVHEDNPYFYSEDGVVYTKGANGGRGTELIYYPRAKTISYTENGKTTSGKFVTPAGVQSIGSYAFYQNTKLTSLVLSKDLLYINYYSFGNCTALTSIEFEERESPLTLGDYAFYACKKLNGVATPQEDGTTKNIFTIPESVRIEGTNTFASCFTSSSNLYIVFEDKNESTSLNNTFYSCTTIVGVENIPAGVSSMPRTFSNCTGLKSVTFEEDPNCFITTMAGTFYKCTSLESIDLPAVGALTAGTSISFVWSPTSSYAGAFESCTKLKYVTIKSCITIGHSVFKGCTQLVGVAVLDEEGKATGETYFKVPDDVVSIGDGAFYGCSALQEMRLSGNLESIGTYAFTNCTSLAKIEIPTFVSSIGLSAFEGCRNMTDLTLGAGITTIGERAFYGLTKIENLTFPDALETIGDYAFYSPSSLKAIHLPASVKTVGEYAFAGCSSATEIVLEDGVETLGDYAFAGASKVENFSIPGSLMNLGVGVFSGWDSLKNLNVEGGNLDYAFKDGVLYNSTYTKIIYVADASGDVVIPNTVLSLAEGLFAGTAITSIVLPDTITELPAKLFQGCTQLKSVKMPSNLERIGDMAFEGCTSLTSITIPKTVYSTFDKTYVELREDRIGYTLIDEKSDVDGIGHYAFGNCTSLENVIFEEGGMRRLSFGDFAFYNCINLKGTLNEKTGEYEFVIPGRVRGDAIASEAYIDIQSDNGNQHWRFAQGVGMYAFARCASLQNVVFEELEGVGSITEALLLEIGAFYECTSLKSVSFSSALGDSSLSYTGMKGMLMTCTQAAIAENVFYGCKSLTAVNFADNTANFHYADSAFSDVEVKLPACAIEVPGSIGTDYGDGKASWNGYQATAIFGIDGCLGCGSKCEFYNPHNGLFL